MKNKNYIALVPIKYAWWSVLVGVTAVIVGNMYYRTLEGPTTNPLLTGIILNGSFLAGTLLLAFGLCSITVHYIFKSIIGMSKTIKLKVQDSILMLKMIAGFITATFFFALSKWLTSFPQVSLSYEGDTNTHLILNQLASIAYMTSIIGLFFGLFFSMAFLQERLTGRISKLRS